MRRRCIGWAWRARWPCESLRDLTGVALVAFVPHVLVVPTSLGAASVKELVALEKTKPGSFNFSSAGVGSASHMNGELFSSAACIGTVHVPFKGIPEALTEIVTGRIQLFFAPQLNALPQIKDRRVVATVAVPETRDRLLMMGAQPTQFTPEQFNTFIKGEIVKNVALVRSARIAVE